LDRNTDFLSIFVEYHVTEGQLITILLNILLLLITAGQLSRLLTERTTWPLNVGSISTKLQIAIDIDSAFDESFNVKQYHDLHTTNH